MKTRIIHTRFWRDEYVSRLTLKEKILFLYLLTNEQVSICGIYELPDKYIITDLDLSQKELEEAKIKFQADGKIAFLDGWVMVRNVDKYNSYTGEKLDKARERELQLVPKELLDYQWGIDTRIHTSIDTPNNHKSKIINQKERGSGGEFGRDLAFDGPTLSTLVSKFPRATVPYELEKARDWLAANPRKSYGDYLAFFRNWLRRVQENGNTKGGMLRA